MKKILLIALSAVSVSSFAANYTMKPYTLNIKNNVGASVQLKMTKVTGKTPVKNVDFSKCPKVLKVGKTCTVKATPYLIGGKQHVATYKIGFGYKTKACPDGKKGFGGIALQTNKDIHKATMNVNLAGKQFKYRAGIKRLPHRCFSK